jgi:hypothetical protein
MELARVNRALATTRGDIIVTDETGKTILTLSVPTRRRPVGWRASTVQGRAGSPTNRPPHPFRADR